jgi:hypothetical protein
VLPNAVEKYIERPTSREENINIAKRKDVATFSFEPFDKLTYIEFHAWFTPKKFEFENNNPDDSHEYKHLKENVDPEKLVTDKNEGQDMEYFDPSVIKRSGLTKRIKPRIIRSCRFNIDTHPDDYYREMLMLYTSW